MSKVIMGIELEQRKETAANVQEVLTDYGCFIKTRIGLHSAADAGKTCSEKGLIVLELISDSDAQTDELEEKLTQIHGVHVKTIEF
ncbi:MAG: hypothetical protein K0S71_1638 [Clostridia bacterium]|jgi:hypothetical protein|nr:hypothetical protein [Clostridia bacterium]